MGHTELGSGTANRTTYRFSSLSNGTILARAELNGQPHMATSRDGGLTFVPDGLPKLPDTLMGDVAEAYKLRIPP
jgi:hypothetical protein